MTTLEARPVPGGMGVIYDADTGIVAISGLFALHTAQRVVDCCNALRRGGPVDRLLSAAMSGEELPSDELLLIAQLIKE